MNTLEYIKMAEAQEKRVNKFLKTLNLGDGSKVILPKTPSDPHPVPRKSYFKELDACINDFLAKESNR